jgi:hypothetical protein
LDLSAEVAGNLKGRDLNVEIKKKKLVVAVKGQEPIISVCSPTIVPFLYCIRNLHSLQALH